MEAVKKNLEMEEEAEGEAEVKAEKNSTLPASVIQNKLEIALLDNKTIRPSAAPLLYGSFTRGKDVFDWKIYFSISLLFL